jgi:hypothetical protein
MAAADTTRPARLLAGLALAGLLALTGCASGDDDGQTGPASDGASASAGQGQGSGGDQRPEAASDEEAADVVEQLELGDRKDQQMAQAAAERAAGFGFVRQRSATAEEIRTTREDNTARLRDSARTTVEPSSCKAPLNALDFSPILLDQDEVTRVDVGADSFTGTGTIEVAALDGPARQRVEKHLQTVNTLLTDCQEMTMTVTDSGTTVEYTLTTAPPRVSDGTPAQSALTWTRTPTGDDAQRLTAQVLTATTPDAVVMVSFVGQEAAGEKEFTLMAEEILAAAERAG